MNRRIATLCGIAIASLALSACYATTGPAPVQRGATVAPGVEYQKYPQSSYEGRPVFLFEDRWYYRNQGRWHYYQSEPEELRRYREHLDEPLPARWGDDPKLSPPVRRRVGPQFAAPPAAASEGGSMRSKHSRVIECGVSSVAFENRVGAPALAEAGRTASGDLGGLGSGGQGGTGGSGQGGTGSGGQGGTGGSGQGGTGGSGQGGSGQGGTGSGGQGGSGQGGTGSGGQGGSGQGGGGGISGTTTIVAER